MNLANSAIIEPPNLRPFGHPPMDTDNLGNGLDGIVTARKEKSDGIWRRTERDDRMAHTHDNIKTRSENISYRKLIRDLDIETREVLERETSKKILKTLVLD